MSATWFVYANLDASAALAVADAANEAIGAWLAEHDGGDEDRVPELGAGGPVPTQPEVAAACRRYRLDLPDAVVERLATCRASIALDHPGALGESALTVSVLRFVLARVGPALVMFNDYPLVPSEEVLRGLQRRRGARGFEESPPTPARRPTKRRAARAGELRAIRVRAALERALEDPDLAVDVRAALVGSPELARRWAALLLEGSAVDDVRAAKELGVERGELEAAAEGLDRALATLVG